LHHILTAIGEPRIRRWNFEAFIALRSNPQPGTYAEIAAENNRLKEIVADLTLDREMLQDVIRRTLRPAGKRKLIDGLLGDWGISIRRACKALKFDTSTYQYKSRRTGQAGLEQRIKEICQTRVCVAKDGGST
jgi:hypothetical protein